MYECLQVFSSSARQSHYVVLDFFFNLSYNCAVNLLLLLISDRLFLRLWKY